MDYKTTLSDVFYNTHVTDKTIDDTISLVLEQYPSLTEGEQLEEMINLLIESGDSTLSMSYDEEEGAVGFSSNGSSQSLDQYMERLLSLFPDISIDYLTKFCQRYENFDFDTVVNDLTKTDYVKVDKDPIDLCEHLKQVLPNADPIYLRNQARALVHRPEQEIRRFIENAIETNDYPTMQQYLINKEIDAEIASYTRNFSIAEYLKKVPDPLKTFLDPNRKPILADDVDESDIEYALTFLYSQFNFLRKKEIKRIFDYCDKHLIKACAKLKCLPKAYRHPRTPDKQVEDCKNVELLKEISFLKHERAIRQYIKQKDERYRAAFEDASLNGLLETCLVCYDELIPEECFVCNKGCVFCKDCVRRGAEVVIGNEETYFRCLAYECDSEFHYATLQMVLDDKTFLRVWRRKQIEEVRNANIDGLEQCLFCDYVMIPDEGDLIFKCRNIECMKETCRKCRHEAHIPLRCDEIEYDEDVKIRTQIEKEMTEALLRKCWKCSKQFYKESGCNKMTCVCGAKMCYICGQAVQDYKHFSNSGCPLHTDNLQQLHLNRVRKAAEDAKQRLGINQDPSKLKFDPTRGIDRDVH